MLAPGKEKFVAILLIFSTFHSAVKNNVLALAATVRYQDKVCFLFKEPLSRLMLFVQYMTIVYYKDMEG
jgi:hypothetical protein